MIDRRALTSVVVITVAMSTSQSAQAAPFEDVTADALGRATDDPATDGWSNKVELADINGDGAVDILVANGGDYNSPGAPELSFAYVNNGDGTFADRSSDVFSTPGLTRVIRAADVDGDGDVDLFVGGAWQTHARLYMNDGAGGFSEEGATRLPDVDVTFGDAKLGDIDSDGDLDIVAADWGDGDPFAVRGRPQAWTNDGAGHFTDVTDATFPTTKTGMSWDLELVDADNDLDLDVVVSCKVCVDGGIYLENSGDGTFLDRSQALPGSGNNYELEPFDVDGDGFLDLFTVNDGDNLRERLLVWNAGAGAYDDATADRITGDANPFDDDNAAVWFDADGDGDVDVLVGSLSGADRILQNDGAGAFSTAEQAVDGGSDTPGTLGIAVADLDGDDKLDLVMTQGEAAYGEHVYRGVDVPTDTTAPFIGTPVARDDRLVFVRVNDWKTPVAAFDFQRVDLVVDGTPHPMFHVGEQLFRATVPSGAAGANVKAVDAAGNSAESEPVQFAVGPPGPGPGPGGCGSCSTSSALGPPLLSLVTVAGFARARRRRHAVVGGTR